MVEEPIEVEVEVPVVDVVEMPHEFHSTLLGLDREISALRVLMETRVAGFVAAKGWDMQNLAIEANISDGKFYLTPKAPQ